MLRQWAILVAVAFSFWTTSAMAQSKVFVASSLTDLFEELTEATDPGAFQIVPGGSSTLARQILAGAPAALFISANKEWAEFAAGDRELVPLFGNDLVLVSAKELQSFDIDDLTDALSTSRLAIADPNHVPAGIYTKQALENSGVWPSLQQRLAPFDNVRAAARAVRIGAAKFGVVYKSDAKALGLDIVYEFAKDAHEPIRYWAVVLEPDADGISSILALAKSDAARDIVERFGFNNLSDAAE